MAQVGFHFNWQWPAVTMQYERLVERSRLPVDRMFAEHMRTIADMDLLVTSVRRFVRTAELARKIPSERQPQLKQALAIFNSKWWESLKAIRDALEHFDETRAFPVPAIAIPTSGDGGGNFVFAGIHDSLNLGKMYEDVRAVAAAIAKVIEPAETEQEKAALVGHVG